MAIEQHTFITDLNELDFSDSCKKLEELKQIIFNVDENNQAKLEFIKEEILKNRYQIQSMRIAEKLLEHTYIQEINEVETA